MGFPTELRKLWNKQMWDRKQEKPVIIPSPKEEQRNKL